MAEQIEKVKLTKESLNSVNIKLKVHYKHDIKIKMWLFKFFIGCIRVCCKPMHIDYTVV